MLNSVRPSEESQLVIKQIQNKFRRIFSAIKVRICNKAHE